MHMASQLGVVTIGVVVIQTAIVIVTSLMLCLADSTTSNERKLEASWSEFHGGCEVRVVVISILISPVPPLHPLSVTASCMVPGQIVPVQVTLVTSVIPPASLKFHSTVTITVTVIVIVMGGEALEKITH